MEARDELPHVLLIDGGCCARVDLTVPFGMPSDVAKAHGSEPSGYSKMFSYPASLTE